VSVLIERTRRDGSVVQIAMTERADGNFHIDAERSALTARRAEVMPGDWVVARQVHGARVVDAADVVDSGLDPSSAPEADALVTAVPNIPIAVQGADCAPLAFLTDGGPIAVAHAGWRGLGAGVVSSVVSKLKTCGAGVDEVVVGPVIGTHCYEFGADDLERVAAELGDDVRGRTAKGSPALDLRAAITSACNREGIERVTFQRPCTACGDGGFSHRARREPERHALVMRIRS